MLFHVIYCIASGAQRLIGPRGNTYLVDQRSRVLTVVLCGTSYLAYGHLGLWGAVLLCSTDSREVQHGDHGTHTHTHITVGERSTFCHITVKLDKLLGSMLYLIMIYFICTIDGTMSSDVHDQRDVLRRSIGV